MNARTRIAAHGIRRRIAALSLPAVALLAAVAALASGASATSSDVTTVTLVARTAHAAALDAAIARFEQLHPDTAIKASYPTNVSSTITSGLSAGTGPDIMVLSTSGAGTAGLPSLWALGPRYLADLSARSWVKDLWAPLLPLASVAGKVYGEPLSTGSIQLVVYNKDVFERLGVTPPTTFGGLLALCNRIADDGTVPIKLAGGDAISAGAIGTALAANTVYTADPNWSSKRNAAKVTFAGTPGWRQAMQALLDMKGARCFDPSPATVTASVAYRAFDTGEAAMMVVGSWDVITNIQQANPSPNIGFFPFPGDTVKNTRVMVNPGEYLAVSAASPVRQQALEFLDFLGRSWPAVALADAENSVSTLDLVKGVVPQKLPLFAPFVKARAFVVSPLIWSNKSSGVAAFRAGVTALLAGTKTVDQVLAETDAAW